MQQSDSRLAPLDFSPPWGEHALRARPDETELRYAQLVEISFDEATTTLTPGVTLLGKQVFSVKPPLSQERRTRSVASRPRCYHENP